jgi:aryl-alcohol dehydrogenase-like predicted oxidoreductase
MPVRTSAWLHGSPTGGRRPHSPVDHSIAEHFGALAELRDAGLVRHPGLSSIRPDDVAEARAIAPVVCVQNS